jgi:hypothetical protein
MTTKAPRGRTNWQRDGGQKAEAAEKNFQSIFTKHFKGTDFKIRPKPREFNNIYAQIELHETVLANIYNPADQSWIHGVIPDYAIDNVRTKKTLYVEVKRQDGWVEGKKRSAGRGNAHERLCKYFTPGLLRILRRTGNLGDDVLPFWIVFQGDIARDPKRVREVTCWFEDCAAHFHMWCDNTKAKPLIDHFERQLKHLLL